MTRVGRRALLAASLASGLANALGRTPLGGSLRLSLPLGIGALDPHSLDEPLAALFGPAVADPLYALDAGERPYPTLATALPEHAANGARVRITLRPGLVTAAGKRLDARDVLFSLDRAQKQGGAAVLGELGRAAADPSDRLSLFVPSGDPGRVAAALASPVTAIVPRGFSALAPDGTGAFRASLGRGELVLTRNPNAARGGAFLERVEVRAARDLAEALRAFESDLADVGWLGSGLHRPRAGAVPFEGPELGWVVLRTGKDAKAWGAPGIAAQLLGRIPGERLRPFGLVPPAPAATTGAAWGGGAADLLVADEEPQLAEIAEALAAMLAQPGHPIRPHRTPRTELAARRSDGRFTLMLDFVRSVGPPGRATLLALLAATNPELTARPPRVTSYAPVDLARGYALGIVGTLRIAGARLPDCRALEAWQLGAVYRAKPG
jgi:peptide/nickel transport system substrate-binding protein